MLLISDEFVFCKLTEYSVLTEHIVFVCENDCTGIIYTPITNSNISQFIDAMIDITYYVIFNIALLKQVVISKQWILAIMYIIP